MADKKIIVLGDLHFPYHNKEALNKIYTELEREQPDYIIQIGDLYDQYCFSRYFKNVNYITPEKELAAGRKAADEMWSTIYSICKNSKKFQLLGNHDLRLVKRVQEKLPEIESLLRQPLKDLFTFDNVTTIYDYRSPLFIDGINFIHGYLSKLGDHSKKFSTNIVVGHSHTGGVVFHSLMNKIIWELNVGFLANSKQLPLQYGESKIKNWTLGYGKIVKRNNIWEPQFIPLR